MKYYSLRRELVVGVGREVTDRFDIFEPRITTTIIKIPKLPKHAYI